MAARIAVTGALGGLGRNVVLEAVRRGHHVRALVRKPSTLPEGADVVRGDARLVDDLVRLTEGVDTLVHAVNIPFSSDWSHSVTALIDAAITACTRTHTRLVYPGNVWVFGRGEPGRTYSETDAHAACSEKGKTRAANEARLLQSGVRFSIVRLPEFYGPHVTTLTGPPLRSIALGRTATWLGNPDLEVEFVYMPDAAKVLLDVALAEGIDGETFHFSGVEPITPRAFFGEAIRQAGAGAKLRALPTWVVRLLAPFSRPAAGFSDIVHLWEAPILLDGTKLDGRFSPQRTSYREGIAATLEWARANPLVKMHY